MHEVHYNNTASKTTQPRLRAHKHKVAVKVRDNTGSYLGDNNDTLKHATDEDRHEDQSGSGRQTSPTGTYDDRRESGQCTATVSVRESCKHD